MIQGVWTTSWMTLWLHHGEISHLHWRKSHWPQVPMMNNSMSWLILWTILANFISMHFSCGVPCSMGKSKTTLLQTPKNKPRDKGRNLEVKHEKITDFFPASVICLQVAATVTHLQSTWALTGRRSSTWSRGSIDFWMGEIWRNGDLEVSWNGGTSKSSILVGCPMK